MKKTEIKNEIKNIIKPIVKLSKKNYKKIVKLESIIADLEMEFFDFRKLQDEKLKKLTKLSDEKYWYSLLWEYTIEDYANLTETNPIKETVKCMLIDEPHLVEKILKK